MSKRIARTVAALTIGALSWSLPIAHAAKTEKEPNETAEQATVVTIPSSVLGYISDRADVDTFKIVTSASYKNVIDIAVKDKKWGFAAGLKVTTKEGNVLSDTPAYPPKGDRTFTLSARPSSTYYISVYCKAECGNGDYTLSLTKGK